MTVAGALRTLPSIDRLLRQEAGLALVSRYGRMLATAALKSELVEIRRALLDGQGTAPDTPTIAARAEEALAASDQVGPRRVFNLTGTVLHTNLGRAVLAEAAITAATDAMRHAVALEYEVETGRRGERDDHLRELLRDLTGAEDATLVNNNAAAVLLVLNTFGRGRESLVSRGELIEIGGAFRLPAIMERAGTRLVEVGTTNRTHPADYLDAIGPDTGLVLKVHTSNYRVEGFTAEVSPRDLAALVRPHGVPLLNDLGSGTLVDLVPFGLDHEPTVREAVAEGADLVTFSGDKLLGGPQAGFIVGRRDLLAVINKNPMKRALRVDKIRIAAIAATLKLYRDPDRLRDTLPTLRFLARPEAEIKRQAERLVGAVTERLGSGWSVSVVACGSQIGSGALPLKTIGSAALAVTPTGVLSGLTLENLGSALRHCAIPIVGRITHDTLQLDLRCLDDEAGFLDSLASLRLPVAA